MVKQTVEAVQLLSVEEFAKRLNLCGQTIRRYIARGTIKAIKIPGGYYRIPEPELTRITQPQNPAR